MPTQKLNVADYILMAGSVLLASAISHSRALLSIGEGLILLSALLRIKDWSRKDFNNKYWIILVYIFVLGLLGFFTSEDLVGWERKMTMKLPLVLLPIGLFWAHRLQLKRLFYIFLTFIATVSVLAVVSTVQYFLNYEEVNALVTQSIPIKIVSRVSHIYFSIFSSFSIICAGYLYLNFHKFGANKVLKPVMLGLGLINLICLHILSARTGLLGFYFSLAALGLLLIVKYKRIKIALIGGGVAVALLVGAYFGVTSFKNRIDNTIVDFKITYNNENPNFRSFAMRFEAWKTAVHIIQDNPVQGVGIGDVEHAMQAKYEEDKTLLVHQNRIPPHNQFLNDGVAYGLMGIVLLIVFFAMAFGSHKWITHPLFLGFWGVVLMGFLFESVLERQQGVAFVAFFLFFIQAFIKAEQQQAK